MHKLATLTLLKEQQTMKIKDLDTIFTPQTLAEILPEERSDRFFEALLGDADEGAYTIALTFQGQVDNQLQFHLELRRRPQKCLVCNLTFGLPDVFQRHPVVDLKGLVANLENRLVESARITNWALGATEEVSADLHRIPLILNVDSTF